MTSDKRTARPSRNHLLTPGRLWAVMKEALNGWSQDNVPRMGAALAYYTLIALAPILVVAITMGGMLFGRDAVQGEIVGQISGLVGRPGASAVK